MKMPKVKPILKDSYLKLIENSVGAKIWRNFYAEVNGRKRDILRDGELSCAFFVSSVLSMFGLISEIHTTVNGTIKDMKRNGWYEIKKPQKGAVILWEKMRFDKEEHFHIGFVLNKKQVISNNYKLGSPQIHHITSGINKDGSPKREIEKIFWHKKLV